MHTLHVIMCNVIVMSWACPSGSVSFILFFFFFYKKRERKVWMNHVPGEEWVTSSCVALSIIQVVPILRTARDPMHGASTQHAALQNIFALYIGVYVTTIQRFPFFKLLQTVLLHRFHHQVPTSYGNPYWLHYILFTSIDSFLQAISKQHPVSHWS